tara:strand:- start:361 stop:471 length:111 start_codon:yes stop_codon:yes gene_type:complete
MIKHIDELLDFTSLLFSIGSTAMASYYAISHPPDAI